MLVDVIWKTVASLEIKDSIALDPEKLEDYLMELDLNLLHANGACTSLIVKSQEGEVLTMCDEE